MYSSFEINANITVHGTTDKSSNQGVEVRGDVCICLYASSSKPVDHGNKEQKNSVRSGVKVNDNGLANTNEKGLFEDDNRDEKMCQLYFNTAFIENGYLCLGKKAIDMAHDDVNSYSFMRDFKVELFLQKVNDNPALNTIDEAYCKSVDKGTLDYMFNYGDPLIEEEVYIDTDSDEEEEEETDEEETDDGDKDFEK